MRLSSLRKCGLGGVGDLTKMTQQTERGSRKNDQNEHSRSQRGAPPRSTRPRPRSNEEVRLAELLQLSRRVLNFEDWRQIRQVTRLGLLDLSSGKL
jgi:hypothetical protein